MAAEEVQNVSASSDAAGRQQPSAPAQFGKPLLKEFLFDPAFRNLNHGSFGSIPKAMQLKMREYQDLVEARPDPFIRYDYPRLLDESREAIAKLLRVPTDTVVFVPNATAGVNAVLHNIVWSEDGKDEILQFTTVYGGCGKSIDFVVDHGRGAVSARTIEIAYPIDDDEIIRRFHAAVQQSRADGKRPRIAIYDTVSSMPGVRFPFETITQVCKDEGILSLVDGAQGVGMIDLDLGKLDPDFFVSNCHKWLLSPRGCAVFYVPFRNQDLVPSTIPTSHGYISKTNTRFNPLPASKKPQFVANFGFVGTLDNSPFLCVKDAIKWREERLGGEERILQYLRTLARDGGARVAEILGTEVMNNKTDTMVDCAMVNIKLPLTVYKEEEGRPSDAKFPLVPYKDSMAIYEWIMATFTNEYNTFIVVFFHNGGWWTRLSAQVYLDLDDFEWAGNALKEICGRVLNKEYQALEGART